MGAFIALFVVGDNVLQVYSHVSFPSSHFSCLFLHYERILHTRRTFLVLSWWLTRVRRELPARFGFLLLLLLHHLVSPSCASSHCRSCVWFRAQELVLFSRRLELIYLGTSGGLWEQFSFLDDVFFIFLLVNSPARPSCTFSTVNFTIDQTTADLLAVADRIEENVFSTLFFLLLFKHAVIFSLSYTCLHALRSIDQGHF